MGVTQQELARAIFSVEIKNCRNKSGAEESPSPFVDSERTRIAVNVSYRKQPSKHIIEQPKRVPQGTQKIVVRFRDIILHASYFMLPRHYMLPRHCSNNVRSCASVVKMAPTPSAIRQQVSSRFGCHPQWQYQSRVKPQRRKAVVTM